MYNKKDDLYTIGAISEITGLSQEGIRYYEREGFIKSQRTGNSRYRLYSLVSFRILRTAIKFRNMGFNVKETSHLLNIETDEVLVSKFKEQREKIYKDILRKQMILEKIDRNLKQIEDCHINRDTFQEVIRPGLYYIDYFIDSKLITDKKLLPTIHKMMKLQPISRGYLFCKNLKLKRETAEEYYRISLVIFEEEAKRLNLEKDENLKYLPPCKCLYIITNKQYSDVFKEMLIYMDDRGWAAQSDMMYGEINILRDKAFSTGYKFSNEVWIPIG